MLSLDALCAIMSNVASCSWTATCSNTGLPMMYVVEPVSGYMPSAAHTYHALNALSTVSNNSRWYTTTQSRHFQARPWALWSRTRSSPSYCTTVSGWVDLVQVMRKDFTKVRQTSSIELECFQETWLVSSPVVRVGQDGRPAIL